MTSRICERRRVRTGARASALVLAALLLMQAPALATTRVRITGGGFGHGIGMSQYGAYGRALKGRSATEILEHYYTGARVTAREMPDEVRVGLLQGRSSVTATSPARRPGGGRVAFRVTGADEPLAAASGATWRVEPAPDGRMRLYKDGVRVTKDGRSTFGSPSAPLQATYRSFGSMLRIAEKGRSYAYGRMVFDTYAGCAAYCVRVVAAMPMQKYLYGLGEVPSSWPRAALETQAIAGRTYAYEKVVRLGQHRSPCDCAVYDSTYDQAYIGDSKRIDSGSYWDEWQAAVDATDRLVVTYGGQPIQALYSSSSGGYTEHNENVWGGSPIPYLRGVPDDADAVTANPSHRWSVSLTWAELSSKLNAYYGTGTLRRFTLVEPFGVSGRVTIVRGDRGGATIVGSARTVRASGWSLRSALGLRDSLFRIQVTTSSGATTGSVLPADLSSFAARAAGAATVASGGDSPALGNGGPLDG
ncbi:MAG TPA: SpoIID/LytB domain-containing protein [Actinomycetota bacterium]|nr:SpoIID/LytB domain-containing protein [Actinomycetota bacterium]